VLGEEGPIEVRRRYARPPQDPEHLSGRIVSGTGVEHDGAYGRNLWCDKRVREVKVLASETPEMLERLRERFLRALSELSGGAEEGKPAMVSEVAQRAGLDPERDPDEKALSQRLAAELVEAGYASAEATSSGFLVITPEGERAGGGGQSPSAPS